MLAGLKSSCGCTSSPPPSSPLLPGQNISTITNVTFIITTVISMKTIFTISPQVLFPPPSWRVPCANRSPSHSFPLPGMYHPWSTLSMLKITMSCLLLDWDLQWCYTRDTKCKWRSISFLHRYFTIHFLQWTDRKLPFLSWVTFTF